MAMRLAVDENLGRLATWLRVLGLDTIFLGTGPGSRGPLIKDRIFLTRNRKTAPQGALIILSDDPEEQLIEAARALSLEPKRIKLFSRCLRCNALLLPLGREEAAGRVPDYVLATQKVFKACPGCGRVFWPGSHQSRMARRLERLRREIA